MSVTVSVDELKVGMFVHLDLGWWAHPFALSNFIVSSPDQIETIRSLGLKSLRYSPEQSPLAPVAADPARPASSTADAELARPAAASAEAAALTHSVQATAPLASAAGLRQRTASEVSSATSCACAHEAASTVSSRARRSTAGLRA